MKNKSDLLDQEFSQMRKKYFESNDDILQKEIENFRKEREKIVLFRNDEDKIIEKIIYEIDYRRENEKRAENDKAEIKSWLIDMEKTLLNTRDLERKREFQKLLQERDTLTILEDELYKNALEFKELYDKLELMKMNGRKLGENEVREKYRRVYEIKTIKEQIDYERQRIHENIEKLKYGDVYGLRKNMSSLLAANHILNPTFQNYSTMKGLDVGNLQDKIVIESERLKNLRVKKI